MIKRLFQILFAVSICLSANGQEYNAIATAYVTTTISQSVVFDSTMQAGGTFTFSVLAHNGGGRANQPDTANVKIQFYNSSGGLVSTVNSTYSANLPIPTAKDPPQADPAVPWTVLTISSTNCGGSCANVAYAVVSMYGIDGSYWAGDYGPWYRAPTLQLNGGGNLLYNPEFGPYNGYQAQGWNTNPGMGACQGAWGGSNPCIVNNLGVPGTSTIGLVANANGGGPSITGGTINGTAGGYNNTMSVTNAGAGTGLTPVAPVVTVTGTSITYTTRNVVSGNTTSVYRTPVTTTTYSDGSTTSSNGTETLYQTKVSSTVTTNKIVGTTLVTTSTPINTVTTGTVTTIESNGSATSSTQNVQRGLTYEVWRYDPKNYNCFLGICAWNFTYRTPSTNRNDYGTTVKYGTTTNGMYLQTNARLPNNDGSLLGYNDGTVIRYTGTITAPISASHPAGTVYRLYFYNQTDDGFVLRINGGTIINNSTTYQWQAIGNNYNSNGWMDVVAGQSYNLEAWYWNVEGGVGHRFFWDYGDGIKQVPNSAFTTGTLSDIAIDTTGLVYSNANIVDVSGSVVSMYPDYITNASGSTITVVEGAGSSTILPDQQTKIDTWTNRSTFTGQGIYIDQVNGSGNTVTITQTGKGLISGIGETHAKIQGSTNNITINQGVSGIGQNEINFKVEGNNNVVKLNQANDVQGAPVGTNGHYQMLDIGGWGNNITTRQTNNGGVGGHYMETTVTGNGSTLTANQLDDGNKILFTKINGDLNTATIIQKGTGQHFMDVTMTGARGTLTAVQEGTVGHKATIEMIQGTGGYNTLDINQNSNTNPLSFGIQQTCNIANCGTVLVRQTQ